MNASAKVLGGRIFILAMTVFWLSGACPGKAATSTVAAWGEGYFGQTNPPAGLNQVVAVSAGFFHTLALRNDGTVLAWGAEPYGATSVPVGLSNVVSIAAGWDFSLALKNNGTVIAWGYNAYGETNLPTGLTNIVAIAAGYYHALALRNDGTVVAWGDNSSGQTSVPSGLNDAVAIAGGWDFSTALRSDGSVVAWGNSWWGETAIPDGLTNVVAIADGGFHTLALKQDGTVVAWGPTNSGSWPDSDQSIVSPGLSSVSAVSAGGYHSLGLTSGGRIVVWGANDHAQIVVPGGLTNVVAISGGGQFSVALSQFGSPAIFRQPVAQSTFTGAAVNFNVAAWGAPPLTYQWRFNGTNLVGATDASLVLMSPQLGDLGDYSVLVSNGFGSTLSSNAFLAVTTSPPTLSVQPTSRASLPGSNITFAAKAVGSMPMTYQWQFNGTNMPGATKAALVLTNMQVSARGVYSVVVSNVYGMISSSNAILSVVVDLASALGATNLVWTTSPNGAWFAQAATTHNGLPAAQTATPLMASQSSLQTVVTGPGMLSFWWKMSFSNYLYFAFGGLSQASISGPSDWRQSTFYLGPGTANLVWACVRRAPGLDWTNAAWVSEVSFVSGGTAPSVTVPPTNQTISAGSSTTFNVAAVGTPPLSYRWLFSGAYLLGATRQTLSLADVQSTNEGDYSVVVTNTFGAITSSIATLTVNPTSPFVIAQPVDQVMVRRGFASFSVAASGSEPFTYQWQFNGTNILGATNSTLMLTNAQADNVGGYTVMVSNAYGVVLSSSATFALVPSAVLAWGDNSLGQLNIPPGLTNLLAIAAGGDHSLALKSDGTVAGWSDNAEGQISVPPGLSSVVAIAAGGFHSLAVKADRTMAAWGDNLYGEANVPSVLGSNVIAVSGGDLHSLALTTDHTVLAWGFDGDGETDVPLGLSNVVAIAAGSWHSLALKSDGTVTAWGGQTVPPGLDRVVAIAGGGFHSLALRSDGTVVAWGDNGHNQINVPSSLTNVVAVSAGYYHSLALQADGTVVAWGDTYSGELNVPPGLCGAMGIGAGGSHSLALLNDGSPFIATQPFDQTAQSGTTATLWVGALGWPSLSYQWQFSGTNLPGGTNCVLRISNTRPANAGSYRVIVSNIYGSVSSSVAALTIIGPSILLDAGTFGLRSNRFSFSVASMPGQAVVVEASTNLATWMPVQTNYVTSAGWFIFADDEANQFPRRFYRARLYVGTLPRPTVQANDRMLGFQQGRFGFNLTGIAGQTVAIETSTNLVNWTPIATNLLSVVPIYFSDLNSTNVARRFYRIRVE